MKTIQLLEENREISRFGSGLLYLTLKTLATKETYIGLHQNYKFSASRNTIKILKRTLRIGENNFQS